MHKTRRGLNNRPIDRIEFLYFLRFDLLIVELKGLTGNFVKKALEWKKDFLIEEKKLKNFDVNMQKFSNQKM